MRIFENTHKKEVEMSLPFSESYKELLAASENRILILDGGFGTMRERFKFSEGDFRGARFL